MRTWHALPIAVVCLLSVASPAVARTIAPASLVPRPLELPGFGFAQTTIQSATTPQKYVEKLLEDNPAEVRKEARLLGREGFREGVRELFSTEHTEATAITAVFSGPRGAKGELGRATSEELKYTPAAERFQDPAVPGSLGFLAAGSTKASAGHPSEPFRYANLFFRSGRCMFFIGDTFSGASATNEELERAPLAGATALFARIKHLCAG